MSTGEQTQFEPEQVILTPQPVLVIRETLPIAELPPFFARAFPTLLDALHARGQEPAGGPLAVYYRLPTDTADVGAAIPTGTVLGGDDTVQADTLPGGPAVQLLHVGDYAGMGGSYDRIMQWMGERGQTPGPVVWEYYLNEPKPDHLEEALTLIVWPIAS